MRKGGREEESDKRERKEGRKGGREEGREGEREQRKKEGRKGGSEGEREGGREGKGGSKKETKIKKSTDTINRNNCNSYGMCVALQYTLYIVHVYTTILTLNLQIGRPLTGISESEFDQ